MEQGIKQESANVASVEALSCEEYPPGTKLRKIVIFRKPLAIEEEYISLIRPLSPKKRKEYFRTSNVPVKDFSRFLQNLSSQFRGYLSKLKDGQLKKLILPVMVPSGIGLPEMPDESSTKVAVLSTGRWNGTLFCAEIDDEPMSLREFQKAKNGDIMGTVVADSGEKLSLLNMESVLKREGFLSVV